MLVFLTCALLAQFEPAKIDPISLEDYAAKCEEHGKEVAMKALERKRPKEPSKIGYAKMSPQAKRALKAKKAEFEKLEKEAESNVELADIVLMVRELKVGDIGVLSMTVSSPVSVPNGRGGVSRFESYSTSRATVRVFDVVDNKTLLLECGNTIFAAITDQATTATDGASFDAKGVYRVVGRYTYSTVQGGKSTVPVVELWEHSGEWQEKREELKALKEKSTKKKTETKK